MFAIRHRIAGLAVLGVLAAGAIADETVAPADHLTAGRDYFARKEYRAAAGHIRQGAETLKKAAADAPKETGEKLQETVKALEALGDKVDQGQVADVAVLTSAFAQAQQVMAVYAHGQAETLLAKGDALAATRAIYEAALHVQYVVYWQGSDPALSLQKLVARAKDLREKVERKSRVTQGDVSPVVKDIGREVWRLGVALARAN